MGPICCSKTSTQNYPPTLHKTPKEQISKLNYILNGYSKSKHTAKNYPPTLHKTPKEQISKLNYILNGYSKSKHTAKYK